MKFLLLLTFVVIVVANEQFKSELTEVAKTLSRLFKVGVEDAQKCIIKSTANIEDMRYLEENMSLEYSELAEKESFRRASCAFVCCAQKQGSMIGAEIQVNKVIDELLPGELTKDSSVRDYAIDCKAQAKNQTDECLAGYEFAMCMYKKSQTSQGTE